MSSETNIDKAHAAFQALFDLFSSPHVARRSYRTWVLTFENGERRFADGSAGQVRMLRDSAPPCRRLVEANCQQAPGPPSGRRGAGATLSMRLSAALAGS